MSEVNVFNQLQALEDLNLSQRLIKEFLEHQKLPEKDLKPLRRKLELPESVPLYGVDISVLRQFGKVLTKVFRNYDFTRFFKLIDILWNKNTSLEEHAMALLLIQARKKELDEVDVCLDIWNWLWREFKDNVFDWSLTELIANTLGYQIIDAWSAVETEESQIIWDDLKERARDERNGNWGKIFAVLCPVKRITKLGQSAVLPTLEVILSAISKFDRDNKEVSSAMEKAMMLTMRECAKTDADVVFKFLKKFSEYIPPKVMKDMGRYYKGDQKEEFAVLLVGGGATVKEEDEEQ